MVILGFNGNLNASVGLGDSVYYVQTTLINPTQVFGGQFLVGTTEEPTVANPVVIGYITSIQTNDINSPFYTNDVLQITVEDAGGVEVVTTVGTIINVQETQALLPPPSNSFIFFSKDNQFNISSLTGYFGEVEFRNNSTTKAELFATACDIRESSK